MEDSCLPANDGIICCSRAGTCRACNASGPDTKDFADAFLERIHPHVVCASPAYASGGRLCHACGEGHAHFGRSCRRCLDEQLLGESFNTETDVRIISILVTISVALIITAILSFIVLKRTTRIRKMKRKKGSSAVQRIFLDFVQTVSMLSTMEYTGPAFVSDLASSSSSVSDGSSADSLPLQCALQLDFFSRHYIYTVTPLLGILVPVLLIFCVYYPLNVFQSAVKKKNLCKNLCKKKKEEEGEENKTTTTGKKDEEEKDGEIIDLESPPDANPLARKKSFVAQTGSAKLAAHLVKKDLQKCGTFMAMLDLAKSAVVVTLAVIYSRTSKGLMSTFSMVSVDGAYYIENQPDSAAFTPEHFMIMAASFFAILIFTIGTPCAMFGYIAYQYRKDQRNLMATDFFSKYGFLYEGYHPNRFWWEGVTIIRRLLFLVAVLYGSHDPVLQTCAILAIIFTFVLAQVL